MTENKRREDVVLDYYAYKHALLTWKKYEPYEPCVCKSGKDFKFCCKPLKKKSKAFEMTLDIIKDSLTKKRIEGKILAFEGKSK